MEKNIETSAALEASLADLHASVKRLIHSIQVNAESMEHGPEILDKLPLLDFYNDDLKRNLDSMGPSR